MAQIRGKEIYRPSFHAPIVKGVLPEFYQTEYPRLVEFLEKYYEYQEEQGLATFSEQIYDLFNARDISHVNLINLDTLISEISDGLTRESFHPQQDARLMTRLLADFYRSKGTVLSVNEFFKAFFDEDVEVVYPKNNIFILNDRPGNSLIGPASLKYIQDDKKYQIFSILLKTGMSLNDYESFYKKMVHPAGWYLSAEVQTLSEAQVYLKAGETTDPLETPNYAIEIQTTPTHVDLRPTYSLLVMEENDPVDARTQTQKDAGEGILISSLETLEKYDGITLQQIVDDFNDSIAEWVGVKPPTLDDGGLDASQDYETMDAGEGGG